MSEPDASDRAPGRGSGITSFELEQRNFRRRRIVDAACVLPFIGLFLWLLPLLWRDPAAQTTTSGVLIYLFAVWAALPVATALLIRAIRRASAPDRPEARR